MDLAVLVYRPNEYPINEQESYYIIKRYVKIRTGKDIDPKIETRFGLAFAHREVALMHKMLDKAISWFRENPDKITNE